MCRNGWAFKFMFMFYKLHYLMYCHVTLTVLLKTEIATHIHSFVFHNEQKNQDIGPSSTAADYY